MPCRKSSFFPFFFFFSCLSCFIYFIAIQGGGLKIQENKVNKKSTSIFPLRTTYVCLTRPGRAGPGTVSWRRASAHLSTSLHLKDDSIKKANVILRLLSAGHADRQDAAAASVCGSTCSSGISIRSLALLSVTGEPKIVPRQPEIWAAYAICVVIGRPRSFSGVLAYPPSTRILAVCDTSPSLMTALHILPVKSHWTRRQKGLCRLNEGVPVHYVGRFIIRLLGHPPLSRFQAVIRVKRDSLSQEHLPFLVG